MRVFSWKIHPSIHPSKTEVIETNGQFVVGEASYRTPIERWWWMVSTVHWHWVRWQLLTHTYYIHIHEDPVFVGIWLEIRQTIESLLELVYWRFDSIDCIQLKWSPHSNLHKTTSFHHCQCFILLLFHFLFLVVILVLVITIDNWWLPFHHFEMFQCSIVHYIPLYIYIDISIIDNCCNWFAL